MTEFKLYTKRELVAGETKKKIRLWVIIGHVALIVVPLLIYWVSQFFKPEKPKIIKVTMITLPPDSNQPVSPESLLSQPPEKPKEKKKPKQPKVPPKKKPPKKTRKPKVVKKKPPKKLRKPKVVKKPPAKKRPTKKKPAKPVKKKWKAVSAKDIVVSNVTETVKKVKPRPAFNTQSFTNEFKRTLRNKIKISVARVPAGARMVSANTVSAYYDSVASLLYRMWNQPNNAQLGGRKPSVTVHVSVSKDGSIKSSRISRKSGIAAMDSSVQNLLKRCHKLPIPPGGAMAFNITLVIDE